MAEYKSRIVIIGSGPAGYTAAIYAARAGMEPILIAGYQRGGQITLAKYLENFPGFPVISGNELMEKMHEQAVSVGARIVDDNIIEVDFSKRPFVLISDKANEYVADAVIIATGASAKWLGLESEQKYIGFGVSGCATCDGFFYRGKEVCVVGGGNTAASEALHLAEHASKVTIIHRRNSLKADKIMQDRLFSNPKIEIEWDSVVIDVLGTNRPKLVTGVKVKNLITDKEKDIALEGVFVSVGHHPNTEVFRGSLEISDAGYIVTKPDSCATSVAGVFAAGDVKNNRFRQAIVAAGSGCKAFLEAEMFLQLNS